MNTLSKEAEEKILDAIQDVCNLVADGGDPTSAVIKVAEDRDLSPNFIKLVCTGYNTGATTYQREKSSAILDKLAEFPLANIEEVMGKLYPDKPVHSSVLKQASAISDEYKRAPKAFAKAAFGGAMGPMMRGMGQMAKSVMPAGAPPKPMTAAAPPKPTTAAFGGRFGPAAAAVGGRFGPAALGVSPISAGYRSLFPGKPAAPAAPAPVQQPQPLPEENPPMDPPMPMKAGEANERMKHAYCKSLDLKRELEQKRAEYAHTQDIFLSSLGRLCDVIKAGSYDTESLEYVTVSKYGQSGRELFNCIHARLPNIKRSTGVPKRLAVADWESVPFTLITDCYNKCAAVLRARDSYDVFHGRVSDKVAELLDPFDIAQNPIAVQTNTSVLSREDSTNSQSKRAFMDGFLGRTITGTLGASLAGTHAKTPTQMATDMSTELDDPDHENELRKIQTRTMLQDLMMNDEVISGYDPGEVLDAYNEISTVSPRSSTQAAIMRPLLRKRLTQGAIEPFEAAEMVNIERNLGDTQRRGTMPDVVNKQGTANVLKHTILG